jgi:hypothetical protein
VNPSGLYGLPSSFFGADQEEIGPGGVVGVRRKVMAEETKRQTDRQKSNHTRILMILV